jgi:hypothetical protein
MKLACQRINEIKQQNASLQHVLNTSNYSTYYWDIHILLIITICGRCSPWWPWPLFYSFLIIQPVGRTPWAGDQPTARLPPTQDNTHTQNKCDIHASNGIRTHDPSVWAVEDSSSLRSRGHCDRRQIRSYSAWSPWHHVQMDNIANMMTNRSDNEWGEQIKSNYSVHLMMCFTALTHQPSLQLDSVLTHASVP